MKLLDVTPAALSSRSGSAYRSRTMGVDPSRLRFGLWVAAGLVLLLGNVRADSPTEYQVKAAFLYNFAKFVEWPAGSFRNEAAPLQICVFGRDPFGDGLRSITHEKVVNGHPIEVIAVGDAQLARNCQILFISSSEKGHMKQILMSLHGASVLTVGETDGFIEQTGMINFVLENDRVQFEVNRKAADEAGLKISSKLLSVARSVTV